jgi:SAM-dependent methyltransferase
VTTIPPGKRIEVERCLLCGSDRSWHTCFETNRHEDQEDRYLLCRRCGLVFQSPRLSEQDLNAFYDAQYRLFVQASEGPTEKDRRIQLGRARHQVDFTVKHLKKISCCLDIGSSTGTLLKAFREKYGCEVMGIEPGDAYREHSLSQNIPAVKGIEDLGDGFRRAFDLICMSHVLEHLPDPVRYLSDLRHEWLQPGGHLLLEVPNLYGHHCLELAHLTAFSRKTLRDTLAQSGFKILKSITHGRPRSLIIPLYITVLAEEEAGMRERPIRWRAGGVKLQRKLGGLRRNLATRFLPKWAWLPWPELE